MVNCPACDKDLDVDEEQLQEGGVIQCEDCGTKCEVVNLHPLELEQIHGDEEDDDDVDLDDEDDDFDDDDEEDDDGYDDEDDLDRHEDEDEE
ncbi:MAG: hypothetical protein ACRD04_10275 [Terriglobales bacterium]